MLSVVVEEAVLQVIVVILVVVLQQELLLPLVVEVEQHKHQIKVAKLYLVVVPMVVLVAIVKSHLLIGIFVVLVQAIQLVYIKVVPQFGQVASQVRHIEIMIRWNRYTVVFLMVVL